MAPLRTLPDAMRAHPLALLIRLLVQIKPCHTPPTTTPPALNIRLRRAYIRALPQRHVRRIAHLIRAHVTKQQLSNSTLASGAGYTPDTPRAAAAAAGAGDGAGVGATMASSGELELELEWESNAEEESSWFFAPPSNNSGTSSADPSASYYTYYNGTTSDTSPRNAGIPTRPPRSSPRPNNTSPHTSNNNSSGIEYPAPARKYSRTSTASHPSDYYLIRAHVTKQRTLQLHPRDRRRIHLGDPPAGPAARRRRRGGRRGGRGDDGVVLREGVGAEGG
eukprot:CAMPEP_0184735740 /NCGR_PEP_ID=MMETSP0314-20130426/62047_1 /TAXON_ID=38298 /ORGANISM="Rhodella maculata, Strain CCMP 736" /LENGTH=277 /DNA_ID=CAMNT_0027202789 /DNA_START=113 /DNA_END=945 /DNA_ORIENTATION=+